MSLRIAVIAIFVSCFIWLDMFVRQSKRRHLNGNYLHAFALVIETKRQSINQSSTQMRAKRKDRLYASSLMAHSPCANGARATSS